MFPPAAAPRPSTRPVPWCAAGWLVFSLATAPAVQAQGASEADLKAALTLNFARYVEWPERAFTSRDAPFQLCLVGRDTLGPAFSALETRTLQNRPVKVRRNVPAEDTRGCHIVFASELEERRLPVLLRSLAGQPVLTVGDADGFIDAGGAIGIVPGEQRLQFEVNRGVLDQARLKASSQLLKLARAVLNPGGS